MRTKPTILILTAASLLTGCGSTSPEVNDSSAADITVKVEELESGTTTDTTTVTTVSTSTHLVKTTGTTTATARHTTTEPVTAASTEPEPTATEPICVVTQLNEQPDASADAPVAAGNVCPVTGITLQYTSAYRIYERPLNVQEGVMWYGGHKETYYSENVLPGSGLAIPDRHHGDDGTIRDADGYICVAADYSFLPYGSIVVTSLGPGKVYDTGCAWGTIDIYTCW